MKITKAKPTDWKIIQKLNNQVFESDSKNDEDLKLDWAFTKEGVKYYKDLASGKYGKCMIAWEEDTPVGYIAMAVKDFGYRKSKYIEIENIGVDPKYRSRGIGKLLMKEAKKWAKTKKATKLYLSVFFKNKRALSFYKSLGFYEIAIEMDKKLK